MSLKSNTFYRIRGARVAVPNGASLTATFYRVASSLHNLRLRGEGGSDKPTTEAELKSARSKVLSYKSMKEMISTVTQTMHPKWGVNPDSASLLLTSEKCRGTPNATIDIGCEMIFFCRSYAQNKYCPAW